MKVKISAGESYPTLFLRAYDPEMDYEGEAVEMPDMLFRIYEKALTTLEAVEKEVARWARRNVNMDDDYGLRRWAGVE